MNIIPIKNVGVYHDLGVSLWHFDQLNDHCYRFNHQDYFRNPESIDSFLNSDYSLKFAGYHVPYPPENTWVERFHKLYKAVNHSFIFCSELHEHTVEQLLQLDLPNVTIFICGALNSHKFVNAKVYQWMDWFVTTAYFYSVVNSHLIPEKIQNNITKEKYFDVLLGCARSHRDFVYNYIIEHNLQDKMLLSYHRRADIDLKETGFIFETDGLQMEDKTYYHTVDPVKFHGHAMSLSQTVPFTIYNQTHYSIVAETNYFNEFNFYTEKIVKPIMCGRLFIVIAGQYYLKNLRNMGFKTFDSIIDESYDTEPDHRTRWKKALTQMELLCSKNPEEIQDKIKDIVKHNQSLMLSHDWYREFSLQLKSVLDLYLTADHKVVD